VIPATFLRKLSLGVCRKVVAWDSKSRSTFLGRASLARLPRIPRQGANRASALSGQRIRSSGSRRPRDGAGGRRKDRARWTTSESEGRRRREGEGGRWKERANIGQLIT